MPVSIEMISQLSKNKSVLMRERQESLCIDLFCRSNDAQMCCLDTLLSLQGKKDAKLVEHISRACFQYESCAGKEESSYYHFVHGQL